MHDHRHDIYLTDAGLETELLFLDGRDLPDFASFPLLDEPAGRERLVGYYRDFVALADGLGVGAVLETPTWRASADWGARLGVDAEALARLNADAVAVLREAVDAVRPSVDVVVSGNLGPRGDGYLVEQRMDVDEAAAYHRPQVEALAGAGADRIAVVTVTYAEEGAGVARAAAAVGVPVLVSFTVETDGRLPSGQPLADAVAQVDRLTDGYPTGYGVNCAHPDHVHDALDGLGDQAERVHLFRANASRMSHAELDEATELDDGDPLELGAQLADLRRRHPHLTTFGGCCGTDLRHVRAAGNALTGAAVGA
ncbi:homocysteine S-methyltransferase family protein [Aquipuribacter sp. SD81]|uniref:homocysteine S-methyltransferase family protein n=1 Tax=Aquipuribacter sp. SD81 TaxID=3127703 RepID=UPI00301A4844